MNIDETQYFKSFGKEFVAPITYSLSKWLYDELEYNDTIYFCSRDGYIPYKIFEYFNKKNKHKNIKIKYLYTSRNSLVLPVLYETDKKEFLEILTSFGSYGMKYSLKDVLEVIDIDYKMYMEKLKNFGFLSEDIVITKKNRKKLVKFINNIYDDMFLDMKMKKNLIEKYFKQEGLFEVEKIKIFDIGWRGSIQRSIQIVTNKETFGYYFGTSKAVHKIIRGRTKGYIFEDSFPKKIYNNIMMYEFLFSAPHPTVICFNEEENVISPIFHKDLKSYKEIKAIEDGVMDTIPKLNDKILCYEEVVKILFKYEKFIKEKVYNDMVYFSLIHTNTDVKLNSIPYVKSFPKEQIINNKKNFINDITSSMWRGAFLIDEIENEIEYKKFVNQEFSNLEEKYEKNLKKKHVIELIKKIISYLKNPTKIYYYYFNKS